ncbi:MAG: glucose-6-phosphate isomerase [Acidimicrobiia bacterium]
MAKSTSFSLGPLTAAVEARLSAWSDDGTASRLFARDHTLWVEEEAPEIADRLGWLTLGSSMRPHLEAISSHAKSAADVRDVVLLGMGGSSLAPEVFQRSWKRTSKTPRIRILDSTHPAAVARLTADLDPASVQFIVSSKSGTTVEPLSFMKHFWEFLDDSGVDPGPRFIAITDPGSPLVAVAGERGFAAVFETIPDVGGRYSALTHFGLLPAAMIGADPGALLDQVSAIEAGARDGEVDSGFGLGAVLGEAALAGRNKATWIVPPALEAFPDWVEQLVAESTGKAGSGIVPIAAEPIRAPDGYADDRIFIHLSLTGREDPNADHIAALAAAGHPVVHTELADETAIVAEMFRSEIAVALASSILGLHPFNQPDVERAKALTREAMAGTGSTSPIEETAPEHGGAFVAVVRELTADDPEFIALQAFIAPNPEVDAAIDRIRRALGDRSTAATTFGYGPRFLHSTGQLHKGGPSGGRFLQIVDHASPEIPVPGTDYSFARLIQAQADGDHRALQGAGRTVTRVCLGDDVPAGLKALEEALR